MALDFAAAIILRMMVFMAAFFTARYLTLPLDAMDTVKSISFSDAL
jgi:hypothetical protein